MQKLEVLGILEPKESKKQQLNQILRKELQTCSIENGTGYELHQQVSHRIHK